MKLWLAVFLTIVLAACESTPQQEQKAAPPPAPARPPDENAALTAIKKVNEAQEAYFFRNRRYALTYEELKDGHFLTEVPTVANTGYDMRLRPKADASGYTILAAPSPSSAAARHFFSDQTGTVRAEQG